MDTKLVTARAIGKAVGLTTRRIGILADRGEIPAVDVGGKRFFILADVLKALGIAKEEGSR